MVADNDIDILLVEDSTDDVELAIKAFQKYHFHPNLHIVNDGREALDFIYCRGAYEHRNQGNYPKLILLDLKLPKISGLQVLKVIKSDENTQMIPVVVMTTSNMERDINESYRLGANSFVTKSINFNEFRESIAQIGHYWLSLNKTVD